MKKFSVFILLFTLLLTAFPGCSREEEPAPMGDFSYALPEGYSSVSVSGDNCIFVKDQDGQTVGGVERTGLRKRVLSGKGTTKILKYLQEDFHGTNNVEFVSFVGGDADPFVDITLTRNDDMTGEKTHFHHIFFQKYGTVYNGWFDEDVIDPDVEERIKPGLLRE